MRFDQELIQMTISARLFGSARLSRMLAALILLLVWTMPALAQDQDPAQDLEDFVHYTIIARPDLASARAQTLLESGITNAELAALVDESDVGMRKRFDEAVARGLLVPELEDFAAELGLRAEQGRLDLARDADRINEAIGMLGGTLRQRLLARQRLKAAGEYAMPALLKSLIEERDGKIRQECRNMIVEEIARQAVTPLCEALASLDGGGQRTVCTILGDIGYPHAAPYLLELALDQNADTPVREAADRAFRAVGGEQRDLSDICRNLGLLYYNELGSLIAFPYEDTNNIWSFDPFVGLVPTQVPTSIYSEIMAMRMAAKAIAYNPGNRSAVSLYVAANLKRENDLPAGETDPIYGETQYSPDFYATVFGTQICMEVLSMALDTTDTPLIRDAIRALADTTGGSNLFATNGGRQPLLEALAYPDRRVQYEAGLTLARALPSRGFTGDFRVVPLLASAVRTGNQSFALVIADDEENRRQEVINLEGLGFTIIGAESNVGSLRGAMDDAVGIDIVVIRMGDAEAAQMTLAELRTVPKAGAAPVLMVATGVDAPGLDREFRSNPRVKVVRPALGEEAFENAVNDLLLRAVGGRMTEAEAEAYALDSLEALRNIAISGSPAYELVEAEPALLDALDARTGATRKFVAEIIALMDSARSQQALFDAALAATGGERIDLLDQVAVSVKRFGNRAQQQHIVALLDLVANSGGTTAEAAARVHGALNLPSTEAVILIQP